MFTFDVTPVKFVCLLILFAWCAGWSVYELTRPQDGRQRVSNVLHLVMSVVMLLMVPKSVWQPFISVVTMPVVLAFFALATAWFASLAVDAFRRERATALHFCGHTAMFAAMTWHLGAMAVKHAAMSGGMGHSMPSEAPPGGVLWTFALVGVPFMAYLLTASVADLRRVLRPRAAVNDACPCGPGCACGPDCACTGADAPVVETTRAFAMAVTGGGGRGPAVEAAATQAAGCHEARPVGSPGYRLSALSDFAMNFGMFWMSTGLMVPLLPFFAFLAF